MQIDSLMFRLASISDAVIGAWCTMKRIIWYRHLISITNRQWLDMDPEKSVLWYKDDGGLSWVTINGYDLTHHKAFHRREDLVMFKLRISE